ncbi:hypothetical protein [Dyadobacter sp. SG02]|uniref:hypothetical protein n=1 Tax=Dyadobacter sp. SG02 TaxID=1855291 RepID=UPI0015A64130|nr:hypothetical protein [Dyadobacter sp. SG02]
MKKVFALVMLAMVTFSCSEKEIAPEAPVMHVEGGGDEQPPKSNCNGLPNCK